MAHKLSVTIITKNEEKNIKRCLDSVSWADEIVVVDSGSTDRTLEICRQQNCRIIETKWLGFGPTKKLAVDSASFQWIFSIDADEEMTSQLRDRVKTILQNPDADGYRIKRDSFYLDRIIKHCGWDRDYPLRLFNKNRGNFNDKIIHESVRINGTVNRIKEPLRHYTYPSFESHIQRMNRYSSLGAEKAQKDGKKATMVGAIFRGSFKFLKMYFLQRGFLDGKLGFILSWNSAFGVYLKYLKLWEMNR